MSDFFENLGFDEGTKLQLLSKLSYELRENRSSVLKQYGATDEADLLQQIQDGTVEEHPAYEHFLAARILADTRESVRAEIGAILNRANRK